MGDLQRMPWVHGFGEEGKGKYFSQNVRLWTHGSDKGATFAKS